MNATKMSLTTKTRQARSALEDFKKKIESPERWRHAPFFPIKNPSWFAEKKWGVIICNGPGWQTRVYLIHLEDCHEDTDFNHVTQLNYDSVESLVAAGWELD